MIRSYKVAFVLLFVGLLVLTVLAVSFSTYRGATKVSLDFSADILSEMSAKVIAKTSSIFEAARGFTELNALLVAEQGLSDHQSLFRIFGLQLSLLPQLESIYVAGPNGDFIQVRDSPQSVTRLIRRDASHGQGPASATERLTYRNAAFDPIAHINGDASYDPRRRDWYQQAVAAEGLQWSPVYGFASTGERGITAAAAVRGSDGALLGVVGADIALSSLSAFLTEQRVARGGVALIIGAENELVAYPGSMRPSPSALEAGELPRVADLQEGWIVDAYQDHVDASARVSGINRVDYSLTETNGNHYLGYREPFPPGIGDDWQLMTVVPAASLLESARRLMSEAAAVSLIMLVVATIAVSYLALRLFKPLKGLVHNTRLIREFRFAEVKRVRSRFTEIKAMDDSIWKMSQALRSLEKFVPTDVGRALIKSGKRVEPGAEVRELAILVTGATDLASLCGAISPERIIERLSREIDLFTETILRHKGTIDNFLGESILALWGAPVAVDNAADRACRAAIACRDAEAALRAEWTKTLAPGEPPPPVNLFSVHYGRAIVGTIGSRQRMSWTAIGDNVALGWDLHQLNRRYGTRIIITGEVHRQIAGRYWTRQLDVMPLTNAARTLELFELIDLRERTLTPDRMQAIERYEVGLEALLNSDWEQAEAIFSQLAKQDPNDLAVALMLSRCGARDACFWPGLAGPGDDLASGLFAARAVASPGLSLNDADRAPQPESRA